MGQQPSHAVPTEDGHYEYKVVDARARSGEYSEFKQRFEDNDVIPDGWRVHSPVTQGGTTRGYLLERFVSDE